MRVRHLLVPVLFAATAASACDSGPPGPAVDPPTAPAVNDPAFGVASIRNWYLVATPVADGQDELYIDVTAPEGTEYVDVWVAGRPGERLYHQGDLFTTTIDITDVPAGTHDILLAADGATTAFAKVPLRRTMPLYVLMTTDWDFSDPSTQALDRQDEMHAMHPDLKMTHFVGPYTFTDPAVTEERRTEIANWVIAQRDTFGDEIGLHIHPYCNFVEDAGLTCITDQSTVYADDPSGYTVKVAAYGETDFATLLRHADTLFQARGLGKPTTFRAGGWTASIETFRALEATGYVADTSALNWARLEEWIGQGTGELYRWNMENWAPIGDPSQPYYPNHDDALGTAAPTLSMLEVPDNGIMVDYVSVDEMKMIFTENWDGENPLLAPRTLMMGFHPAAQFSGIEANRVNGILQHVDQHLALNDGGPCVYVTLNQMPAAFPR